MKFSLEDFFIFLVFGGAGILSFSGMEFLGVALVPPILIMGLLNLLSGKIEKSFLQLSGIVALGAASFMEEGIISSFLVGGWLFLYLIAKIIFDI